VEQAAVKALAAEEEAAEWVGSAGVVVAWAALVAAGVGSWVASEAATAASAPVVAERVAVVVGAASVRCPCKSRTLGRSIWYNDPPRALRDRRSGSCGEAGG